MNSAPTVWIFNHYAGWPERVPATRTFELSKRLAAAGWQVTVIACSFNHYTFEDDLGREDPPTVEMERDGVNWVFLKGTPYQRNGPKRLANMIAYARRARRWALSQPRPDVIVGTTVHPVAAEAARRLAHFFGCTFLYEITDLWPETLVDLRQVSRRSPVFKLFRHLERRSFATADGVIGLLPDIPKYALDHYDIRLREFCYVPNGTHVDGLPSLQPSPGVVSYAGGFARAHGMDVIVDAAEILGHSHPGTFQFRLYGDGPERSRLEDEVRHRQLSNIVFKGLVPKADLRMQLLEAQICLCTGADMPIHRYGISTNKLFDYFNAARPVVFAVNSSNNPVQAAGAGPSVPAADAESLAEAILTLTELDPAELEAIGQRGRAFLAKEHAYDALAQRLDAFMRSHLARGVE